MYFVLFNFIIKVIILWWLHINLCLLFYAVLLLVRSSLGSLFLYKKKTKYVNIMLQLDALINRGIDVCVSVRCLSLQSVVGNHR